MAGRRICAGYYRRYDGKVVYVISTATDADTGEEMVIWTAYPFAETPKYYTSSKKSFCAFVEVNGDRKVKYKRLTNMKISEAAIERLEDEGFRGPVRKRQRRQLEEEYDSREYGMDIKTLSTILGHVSCATTLNTYSHITDEMRQKAAVKIDQGIAKAEVTEQEEKPKERTMTTFQARKRWSRKAN